MSLEESFFCLPKGVQQEADGPNDFMPLKDDDPESVESLRSESVL